MDKLFTLKDVKIAFICILSKVRSVNCGCLSIYEKFKYRLRELFEHL